MNIIHKLLCHELILADHDSYYQGMSKVNMYLSGLWKYRVYVLIKEAGSIVRSPANQIFNITSLTVIAQIVKCDLPDFSHSLIKSISFAPQIACYFDQ